MTQSSSALLAGGMITYAVVPFLPFCQKSDAMKAITMVAGTAFASLLATCFSSRSRSEKIEATKDFTAAVLLCVPMVFGAVFFVETTKNWLSLE